MNSRSPIRAITPGVHVHFWNVHRWDGSSDLEAPWDDEMQAWHTTPRHLRRGPGCRSPYCTSSAQCVAAGCGLCPAQ